MADMPRLSWFRRPLASGAMASRREVLPLALLALLAAGVWGFVELADEVVEQETGAIDRAILLGFRTADPADPIGPGWFEQAAGDVTALGGLAVLALITAATVSYLALQRKLRSLALVLTTVLGGWLLSVLAKEVFERPRPDLVPHATLVHLSSFPSGHAMMSASTYRRWPPCSRGSSRRVGCRSCSWPGPW